MALISDDVMFDYFLRVARERHLSAAYVHVSLNGSDHLLVDRQQYEDVILVKLHHYHLAQHSSTDFAQSTPTKWVVRIEDIDYFKTLDVSIFDWLPTWTCNLKHTYCDLCMLCGRWTSECEERASEFAGEFTARQSQQIAVYCSMLRFLPRELARTIGKLVAVKSVKVYCPGLGFNI